MSQKGRVALKQVVDQKIYDNNNKEILASMHREVLADYRDSNFNLIDDELKNVKYNSTQTLEQYLNSVIGAVPVYGTLENVDVATNPGPITTSGIIANASYTFASGPDGLITINFSENIANRRLIPVLTTTSSNWDAQNDVCNPVIRRISSTQITLALREVSTNLQSLNIEIIAI